MNVEIRRLTPYFIDDYVRFFDTTPHATNKAEHKCYCVWWCNKDYAGKDLESSVEARREYAMQCVKDSNVQGYLAYSDGKVVGWCNANTKSDCLQSYSWRRYMGAVPIEEPGQDIKVKSILCFAIAPELRRHGLAKRFVERVCQDAADDGFDFVEAYPNKAYVDEEEDYMGPLSLYESSGFTVYRVADQKLVMRKPLKRKTGSS